jgi:hypothetical protein
VQIAFAACKWNAASALFAFIEVVCHLSAGCEMSQNGEQRFEFQNVTECWKGLSAAS